MLSEMQNELKDKSGTSQQQNLKKTIDKCYQSRVAYRTIFNNDNHYHNCTY